MTVDFDPVLAMSPWSVTVRDSDLVEQESADTYRNLRMELWNRGVGVWSITLRGDHPAIPHILEDGAGIIVRHKATDMVECSGPALDVYVSESREDPLGKITVVGVTDDVLAFGEWAYPNPSADVSSSALSTFAQTHDVRTGAAETVMKAYVSANIGPAAGISRRRYPDLLIPASTGLGASSTWKARFVNLLELLQKIGTYGGVTHRFVQNSSNQIELEIWTPTNNPEVIFSRAAKNVESLVGIKRLPDVNEIIAGGGGEGDARVFTRRSNTTLQTQYGFRRVEFMNQTHSVDLTELRQPMDERMIEGSAEAGVTITPINVPWLQYGVHYRLGDVGTGVFRGVEVTKTIEHVVLEHNEGEAPTYRPSIGLPDPEETERDVAVLQRILRNITEQFRGY